MSGSLLCYAGRRYLLQRPSVGNTLDGQTSRRSGKRKSYALNKHFLKQLLRLLRISIPSVLSKEAGFVMIHTSSLVSRTFLSIYVAPARRTHRQGHRGGQRTQVLPAHTELDSASSARHPSQQSHTLHREQASPRHQDSTGKPRLLVILQGPDLLPCHQLGWSTGQPRPLPRGGPPVLLGCRGPHILTRQ